MGEKWKIDWHGNIVPANALVPSVSPTFKTPADAQRYIRQNEPRVLRGQ